MATVQSMSSSLVCLSQATRVNQKTSSSSRMMRVCGVLGSSSLLCARVPRLKVQRTPRLKGLKVTARLGECPLEREPKGEKFGRGFFLVLESLARSFSHMSERLVDAMPKFKPQTEEELQLLTALKGRMVCAAAPLVLAAISQSAPVNTPLTVVASGMAKWLELYSGVLMVRVLLSWFPNIPWERQPLQAMRDMCDPYLNLFRNIIPPLFNALDLSPMLAFLVLGVLTSILNTTVQSG